MKLALSAAVETRDFSRKFHRVRKKFDSLIEQFSKVEMVNPIHDAILVGVTESMPPIYFAEVRNRDGFFQILAGVDGTLAQDQLERCIFSIVERAVRECPFSNPDREKFLELLQQWRESDLG